MKAAAFYAVATVASLGAVALESAYSRVKKKDWYDGADTATNLNVGAGNVLAGLVLALVVAAGYSALFDHRVADASERLPGWASIVLAIVFADFLQYWNHRASHVVNLLWAGHVTHHSSQRLNLSTGIRLNWLYRGYAWMLYAPMPLLGFSFEAFVAAQAAIGTYNLFMHTRLRPSFGPLAWILVTPAAHGLHHSSDPRHYGNYGAALIVWDRLFGTYRETAPADDARTFGIGRSLGENPLRLNFHYVVELWRAARASDRSFVAMLFGKTPDEKQGTDGPAPSEAAANVPRRLRLPMWVGLAAVAAVTLGVQAGAASPMSSSRVAQILAGLAVVVAFGLALERRPRAAVS